MIHHQSGGRVLFMNGNEACAEAALMAGARFFAGYPITPSTVIAEVAAKRLPELGGTYLQMEDEIASLNAVVGASLAGVKAFTATSGPGFSLMQETLGFASMAEVPCVVIDVMRVGPSTGVATKPAQGDVMQARWGRHGDQAIIALAPSSVQECFDLTVDAFNLSERFRTPVVLLSDQFIGYMSESLRIPESSSLEIQTRKSPTGKDFFPYRPDADGIPPFPVMGGEHLIRLTGTAHDETGMTSFNPEVTESLVKRLSEKIHGHMDEITRLSCLEMDDAEVAVVAYGIMARASLAAVLEARARGMHAGLLQIKSLWPIPENEISRKTSGMRGILVPEMNLGQYVFEIQRVCEAPVYPLQQVNFNLISPSRILAEIERLLA